MTATRITRATLLAACRTLAADDTRLAHVLERYGPPPLWARRPGFATLVQIILEQQVSLVSARAALSRLTAHANALTPERIATLGLSGVRHAGITRQKSRYIVELSTRIVDGTLDLRRISRATDDDAREMLCSVTGIGVWTAEVYLLMALRRPDIWPTADLALAKAVQRMTRRRRPPSEATLQRMARRWRPWRSVAARIVWHDYLSRRADGVT